MEMVKDGMNAANFLGPNHELAIEYHDTACCAQCGANEFVRMLGSPSRTQVFGIVGCACSGPRCKISPVVPTWSPNRDPPLKGYIMLHLLGAFCAQEYRSF